MFACSQLKILLVRKLSYVFIFDVTCCNKILIYTCDICVFVLTFLELFLLLAQCCRVVNIAFVCIVNGLYFPTGLILRTFGLFNVFILLSGWICLRGVLD